MPVQTGLILILLGLALALAAFLLWRQGRAQRRDLGLPDGRIVSADTGNWRACTQPLFSARYRLAGRPDYLVQVGRALVPVEAKPGRTAEKPYDSDVLQLGAYLLLVEEETGRRPPYGLLHYRQRTFQIPYSPALRQSIIGCLDEMRHWRQARDVPPQHDEPQRCLRCGHRDHCSERLA